MNTVSILKNIDRNHKNTDRNLKNIDSILKKDLVLFVFLYCLENFRLLLFWNLS